MSLVGSYAASDGSSTLEAAAGTTRASANVVNGITARLPVVLNWLEAFRPNIVCLQELKIPQERFPADAFRAAGYGVLWHGQVSWNGVSILAKGTRCAGARIDLVVCAPADLAI